MLLNYFPSRFSPLEERYIEVNQQKGYSQLILLAPQPKGSKVHLKGFYSDLSKLMIEGRWLWDY